MTISSGELLMPLTNIIMSTVYILTSGLPCTTNLSFPSLHLRLEVKKRIQNGKPGTHEEITGTFRFLVIHQFEHLDLSIE